jgi:hypothetical protein
MAQKVILVDDLDGAEGAEALRYTVDSQEYEIDLSTANAEKFRKDLQIYIEKSRVVEKAPSASGGVVAAPVKNSARSGHELRRRATMLHLDASRRKSSRHMTRRTSSSFGVNADRERGSSV